MKNLFRNWLVYFLIAWGAYVATQFLIASTRGQDFDVWEKCIVGVVFTFVLSLGPIAGIYSVFPRSKYLESDNIEKPSFKVPCSSVIDLPQGFDFDHLKAEIAGKWLITFSDDAKQVLKFRTRVSFFKTTWGAAAWLRYDSNTGKIHIICFPMVGMQEDDLARKMNKEIGNCLKKVLTVQ